jgi:hypothetical protein
MPKLLGLYAIGFRHDAEWIHPLEGAGAHRDLRA